ncbi:MAG: ATP-binding protein [Hyphomicrobiales bacterium]|nr:ATP-binding protein [Hyphomicrobiales bacterium]
MFPLVRYFSLISAVVVAVAMVGVTFALTQITTEQLIQQRQNANVGLTRVFSSSVWQQFRSHVQSSADLDGDALRAHPRTSELLKSVKDTMRGLSVVKVKVYSLNGNTVFSTEATQMGDQKAGNPGFLSARAGYPISEYSNRAKFSAFENEIFDIDVVSSYIPIRDEDGQVEAVFEVYDNVTATLHKMEERRNLIIAIVGGLFVLLYLSLFLIIHRASTILKRQHGQILDANDKLEDTNDQLVQRTEELEAAQETLVQQERLATLGELTATVSHELRNPLAAIRSSLHLAIQKTKDLELGIDRSLERAERNVVRCDKIVGDLLGYASEPMCEAEQITGDKWLRVTLSELEVPADVQLVKSFNAPDAQLAVAPERIRRAVVNIFENAVQALADMPEDKPRLLTVRTAAKGGNYVIVFEDNGPGMDPELLSKAFEPLFSTKSYGCGLGLPTAKKIIERYRGTIRFDSEDGLGTTVTMTLPETHVQERAA